MSNIGIFTVYRLYVLEVTFWEEFITKVIKRNSSV